MPKELSVLRSLNNEKRMDTSFVRHCLEFLYKSNLTVFKTKSALGAPKRKVNVKDGVVVEVPATERISAIDIGEIDRGESEKKFNDLIGKAIKNIRKHLLKN